MHKIGSKRLAECLDIIAEAENRLTTIQGDQQEFLQTDSALKHIKGIFYRRRGELDLALTLLQECLSTRKKLGESHVVADSLNNIGIIYASKGEFKQAIGHLLESLGMFEKFGNKPQIAKLQNNIGMIYWQMGQINQALEYYHKGLAISEAIQDKRCKGTLLSNIGLINWHKGELDSALDYCQKALNLFSELDSQGEIATCYNNIGIIYEIKGELDIALEFHQKGLAIAEEQGNKQEIGRILNNIGIAYDNKGDLETASDYYRKSLRILEELGNDINTCLPLYALINIATHSGAVETATPFLQQLKVMSEKEESRFISQLYRLAKAKVLKTSERVIKKAEAQELLQQIVNEEIIKHELIVMAMFDLCELLLDEFKAYGGDEVFQEAKTLAESLQTLAQRQNSFSLVVETLILQAKMAIIEGDFIKASETLEKAKITAIEKNLALLSKKASAEKRYMEDQYETWKDLIESNAPFGERLEQARIEGYFASAMKVVKVLRMSEG